MCRMYKTKFCYGADKHVDPANVLSLMRATTSDDLLSELQTCV